MSKQSTEARTSMKEMARRRFAIGSHIGFAMLLALALLLMANYLGYRHYVRTELGQGQVYQLSEKTEAIVAAVTNPVTITVVFQQGLQPHSKIYEYVSQLLEEYAALSDLIRVERVDPDRELAKTEQIARAYELTEANVIVLDHGGRTVHLQENDLVDLDYAAQPFPIIVNYRGEQAISTALQSITDEVVPVVYFLQGHGEREPDSFDRRSGYSAIAQKLRRDNVKVKKLVLGVDREIPADCSTLIIAGPTKRLPQPEVDLIRAYLDRSGRLLIALDALTETGLELLLEDWGVRLDSDVVVDATRRLLGLELYIRDVQYGRHEITKNLLNLTCVFFQPRSVRILREDGNDPADKPHVVSLASCTDRGWAERNPTENPMKFDPAQDVPGPVPVAAAIHKGASPGIDVEIKPTRIVVFGDSDFAANGALTGANADIFLNAVNWLMQRENLIAISPKPAQLYRLDMTRTQLFQLLFVVVLGLPATIGMVGIVVWLRRRS